MHIYFKKQNKTKEKKPREQIELTEGFIIEIEDGFTYDISVLFTV